MELTNLLVTNCCNVVDEKSSFVPGATNDVISMNGGTTGGDKVVDYYHSIEITFISRSYVDRSGTEATPLLTLIELWSSAPHLKEIKNGNIRPTVFVELLTVDLVEQRRNRCVYSIN